LKKKLFIAFLFRKSLVYAVWSVAAVGIYLLVVGFLTAAAGKAALHNGSIMANGLTGLLMAMIFLPLHTRVQCLVDRLFFKDKCDYRQSLRNFSGELASFIEPDVLVETIVEKVTEAMHIERGYMLLLEPEKDRFAAKALKGMAETIGGAALPKDHPALRLLEEKQAIVPMEEAQDIRYPFREQGIQVLVPLITKNRLLAVLCLGAKLSEDAYTGEDFHFLATTANHAAVAIENAQLSLSLRVLEKNLLHVDKMAALGAFSSSMVHEIRNPLASVKTFCQLVARKSSDQAFIDTFNDVVPREIERLERILGRLLDFGKHPAPDLSPVKVEQILEDLLALLHCEAAKSNVKVIRRYDETSPPVMAAGEEIKQVFMNMVLNAIQAMPGGGTLTITTGKSPDNGAVQTVVSFRDSGAGIPAPHVEKLFTPFFSTRKNGTGLGLFVAKRIIGKYNGVINVASREGQGATFTIRLPGHPSSL
jgi:signal transduction histidine kinase